MERPQVLVSNRRFKSSRVARREGFVPIAISQKGKPSLALEAEYLPLRKALAQVGTSGLLELVEQGNGSKKHLAIAREIQRNPISHHILNVSFQEVSQEQKVQVSIALTLIGTPEPVKEKTGQLFADDHILVEAQANELPEHAELDVSHLQLGDVVHVSDVPAPADSVIITPPDTVVAILSAPKVQAEPETTEEAATAETPAETPNDNEAA